MSRYITGARNMKDSSADTQAEVIRRALEYLDTEDKWLQGRVKQDDRRCIAGAVQDALYAVSGETDLPVVTVNLAPSKEFRLRVLEEGHVFIEDWNDDPNRTFADVKAYLAALYEHYSGEKWDADADGSAVGATEGGTDGDVHLHGSEAEGGDQRELSEAPANV